VRTRRRTETDIQGRVTPEDHVEGRAARGFWRNAERVGTFGDTATDGTVGGFKVERHVDASGRECADYDSTLLFGTDIFDGGAGTNVLDMSDPANPVRTATGLRRLATRPGDPGRLRGAGP
jgi:hypothetical protein